MLPRYVLYYGKEEPSPQRIDLRAGPLTMVFEPDSGFLRYVRLGEDELLRGLYVAVRDHNWGTVEPQVSNLQLDQSEDSFDLRFDVDCVDPALGIDFFWKGRIAGDADGTVTYTMDGRARTTFRRNRIGFCVLHPPDAAGKAARIEHVDGTVEESRFPTTIAPQLVVDGTIKPVHPFEEMRALSYRPRPDLWMETRFTGDVFEMEDQRNWTDASYKTYCTPLRLPFPVEVEAGSEISQSVTLALQGKMPTVTTSSEAQAVTVTLEPGDGTPLPRIGLGVASHGEPLTAQQVERLRALNPAHLRVDLTLSDEDYVDDLRRAAEEAAALEVSLEVALHLSDDAAAELEALRTWLAEVEPQVAAWLIFHVDETSTSQQWVTLAREHLADYDAGARFGSGTNAYFTELNRDRPSAEMLAQLDLLCYSINPQVHAFDNASLAETLAMQAETVTSARQLAEGASVAVTPVTLKPRFNPNATGPEPEPAPGELPSQVDERQISLFGAGWTVGSIKYLSESNAASVTYYETTGWRGVMETESGAPVPEKFRSIPGAVFPLYHVLADVGEDTDAIVLSTRSSDPLRVDGLALRSDEGTRVLLANLTHEPQQVSVRNLGESVSLRRLNETNAEEAMRSPEAFRNAQRESVQTSAGTLEVDLMPFEVMRIDSR